MVGMGRKLARACVLVSVAAGSLAPCQDVRINSLAARVEHKGSVATDGSRFWTVWENQGPGAASWSTDIRIRPMDLAGDVGGADRIIRSGNCGPDDWCDLTGAVAALPSGEVLVAIAWHRDGGGPPPPPPDRDEIGFWLFDASGALIASRVLTGKSSHRPTVAAVPPDSFVVAWREGTPAGSVIRGVHIDRLGVQLHGPNTLAEASVGTTPSSPAAAAFASGNVLVAWERLQSGGSVVRARTFHADLTPAGREFDVSQSTSDQSAMPAVAASGSRFVVAWTRTGSGAADPEVVGRFGEEVDGMVTGEERINTYTSGTQEGASCAMDGQGRATIVWSSDHQDGWGRGIFGQRFEPGGARRGGEFAVNMSRGDEQWSPSVAATPGGDLLVTFSSLTGESSYEWDTDVLGRRFFFPVTLAAAPGPAPDGEAAVGVYRPDGGPSAEFALHGGGYGATVGAGDFRGDARHEILAGPGPSPVHGPRVRGFDREGTPIAGLDFLAYGTTSLGVKELGAALDGDAFDEIVTTPGPGWSFGPRVRGWSFDGGTVQAIAAVDFIAYDSGGYGANASRAQLDLDGYDEILTAPGPGPSHAPHVRGFQYDDATVRPMAGVSFAAFSAPGYGATVAAADVESDGVGGYRDGFDEIVAGRGPGGLHDARLRLFDYDRWPIALKEELTAYPTMYGVVPAGGDLDAGDADEIATAPGPDPSAPCRVRGWEWNPLLGTNAEGATLGAIGPDDFVAFASLGEDAPAYGGNVVIGDFRP